MGEKEFIEAIWNFFPPISCVHLFFCCLFQTWGATSRKSSRWRPTRSRSWCSVPHWARRFAPCAASSCKTWVWIDISNQLRACLRASERAHPPVVQSIHNWIRPFNFALSRLLTFTIMNRRLFINICLSILKMKTDWSLPVGGVRWQRTGSKSPALCIFLHIWEPFYGRKNKKQITFIHVFMASMWSFGQYKHQRSSQILHTGSLFYHSVALQKFKSDLITLGRLLLVCCFVEVPLVALPTCGCQCHKCPYQRGKVILPGTSHLARTRLSWLCCCPGKQD